MIKCYQYENIYSNRYAFERTQIANTDSENKKEGSVIAVIEKKAYFYWGVVCSSITALRDICHNQNI